MTKRPILTPKQTAKNKERRESGRVALAEFVKYVDASDLGRMHRTDVRAAVVDLVTNLMHYARVIGFGPTEIVWVAKEHFEAEERGLD